MPHTVRLSSIPAGQMAYIDGRIRYSHITRLVEGQELLKVIERERRNGSLYPHDPNKPYTILELEDAKVRVADVNHMTPLETYNQESLFTVVDRNTGRSVYRYRAENKSRRLPKVLVRNASGGYDEIIPERELANGLNVTIVMRVYSAGQINGIAMEAVMVNEPLRYWEPNDIIAQLQSAGISVNRKPYEPAPAVDTTNESVSNTDAPVQTNPYSTAPAAPTVATAEPTAQAPTQPVQPNPYANPYAIPTHAPQQNAGGIVYNPDNGY